MTYQTYQSPFAARTARQTTSFKDPASVKPAATVFSQPTYAPGVTSQNIAQTLFGAPTGTNPATGSPFTSSVTPPAAAAPSSLYDPSTDPIYQSIRQLGSRNVADSIAGADQIRKQQLIQLGDPTFAHSQQFGDPANPTYGDQSTELAAAQNPYSALAQLAKGHTQNTATIDQTLNRAGGYYSSAHANQLGAEDTRYHQGINDAETATGTQLSSIIDQVLQAKNAADAASITGLGTATQNAINSAIAGGYSFQGYDANGKPVLVPPAAGGGGGAGAAAGGGAAAGAAPPTDHPGVAAGDPLGDMIRAMQTPGAVAARQRGQRGEFTPLT